MASEELCCLFCKESFENKDDLQVHFRKHGDPEFNQNLKIRNKSNETQSNSDKMGEEGEKVSCDVCTEVFPTISKAITHKHKVHPDHDAKYFCPWCGKLFTMKHLYNKHIESAHSDKGGCEGKGFHCDYCDVNFYVPSAMLYHNKFFHRQDTELAAIGQSRKLKMFNQEPLPIYYCPFCGEEYCNKVNLHKHMSDDHNDENQSPDDILRCPLCDAIFYHLDAYEVHLTFHSSEDMYSEENELLKEVTEFSLETTPPIMEKVENDTAEDEEQTMNSIGIESLLQQAMNESADNDNSNLVPEKRKKHKKHKKSKKTITLDEFLNMNKDVFGEGIDVQGIEEVPTQVVAKHLKKQPTKSQMRAKDIHSASSEIEKLKKQGIVIKKKSGTMPMHKQMVKRPLNTAKHTNVVQTKAPIKPDNVSTNDVLTKLFNQSNSQLKIVKTSTTEANNIEKADLPNNMESTNEDNLCDTKKENNLTGKLESTEDKLKKETATTECKTHEKNIQEHEDNRCHSSMNDSEKLNFKQLLETEIKENTINPDKCINNQICSDSPNNVSENVFSKSSPPNNEAEGVKNQDENDFNTTNSKQNQNTKSLDVLKHLSHLVIKSVNKKNESSSPTHNNEMDFVSVYPQHKSIDTPKHNTDESSKTSKSETLKQPNQQDQKTEPKCLDTLKNLNKHLTIKSINQNKTSSQNISPNARSIKETENTDEDENNIGREVENTNNDESKAAVIGNLKLNTAVQQLKSPELRRSPSHSPNWIMKSPHVKESKQSEQSLKQCNPQNKPTQAANLLSNLPNITAKPLNTPMKSVQHNIATTEKTSNNMLNSKNDINQKDSENSEKEIEIFNIDDSDDEEVYNQDMAKISPKTAMTSHIDSETKSSVILKNISKQVTVKPKSNSQISKNLSSLPNKSNQKKDASPVISQKAKVIDKQNSELQNKLKNLSKNITVKSNNSIASEILFSRNSLQDENYDSDFSSSPKKLAITEYNDDDFSDNEFESNNKNDTTKNVIIEYPDDDNSENEHFDDNNDLLDIENEIKAVKVEKALPKQNKKPAQIHHLQNIKDLHDFDTDEEDHPDNDDKSFNIPNIDNNLSIKPFKSNKTVQPENTTSNKNFKEVTQKMACHKVNERTSTSSNQISQEVTVKTIQSKTVVQEITTTVTKTIRTINQTVKQDVRSMTQASSSSAPVCPQKVQNIRPQQIKNFSGTPVRQATPVQRPRIRNPSSQVRPAVRTPVRPCNQLVPVRSGGANIIRPNAPRMTGIRQPASKCSPRPPTMGKPLKISPNAVVSTNKRSSEEPTGPFSCFKKPKESLIPVPNFAEFDSDEEGESSMHYASSHVTKTNFVSSANTVKGDKIVTTNQTKSEMTACSQLKKLSNVSGLTIMKASQSKQTTQVEETSENSAKRCTLEAIEKLQKQGLLLKKPRVEEEYNSEHEHTESEDENVNT